MQLKLLFIFFMFFFHGLIADTPSRLVVSKIKIKSSLLEKDRFIPLYLHEPGDYFDEEQHIRSLALIEKELQGDGYLKAVVRDTLIKDDYSKTLAVSLQLDTGKRYTIGSVHVDVEGRFPDEQLAQELKSHVNSLVDTYAEQKRIDEQGKKLYTLLIHKGFVQPVIDLTKTLHEETEQVTLHYTINLIKRYEYRFVGHSFFTTTQLLDELFSLLEQGILLPPPLLAQDLQELYKKKGFLNVKISWQEEAERVTFNIAEGERYTIGSVKIVEEFTEGQALAVSNRLEADLLRLLAYDEEQVDHRLIAASEELEDLGYWYLSLDKSLTPAPHASKVNLTIQISQTRVGGSPTRMMATAVAVPGYEAVLLEGPFVQWYGDSQARPVRPSDIDQQRRWLLGYLNRKGYLAAQVSYKIDSQNRIIWSVNELKGPIRFGLLQILGLVKMKPFVVRRELCFQEGDIWDAQKIDATIRRLQNLHMFESITFHSEQTREKVQDGNKIFIRPISIKCCEDDPFEIATRFGLQFVSKSFTKISWTTWKLGGSCIWKNPTGYADRIMLDADWTRYTLNVAASYEVPWLGPWPIRTLAKIYSDRFEQPLVADRHHRLYNEAHDGISVTFNHRHPWWVTCVRTGFEVNKLSGISRELARVIQFEPQLVDERILYFYCEPSVTFEHFDDKTDPSQGFFSTFSLKAMVPPTVSDGWFVKALLEQSLFYPLYPLIIGALRWRVGHIFNAKFSTILPTERFYLGGANSLRGYETNMVPPLNDVISDGKSIWVPIGGKSMVNINAELRFPLYKQLSGVLFTDMGILAQDRFADIAAHSWLGASGFGLRFASPIGPIRFDIGWKWKKRDPKDKSYAFFITLGHAF
jgi:outer membrane protein assembly factor BamA